MIEFIHDGEQGDSVRGKLNALIDQHSRPSRLCVERLEHGAALSPSASPLGAVAWYWNGLLVDSAADIATNWQAGDIAHLVYLAET